MIISISGNAGSGKTVLADRLVKELKYKSYYMGGIRRELAKKRGMTLDEFNKLGEKDFSTDKEVDEYATKLGKEEDNFIIQSRTAFHLIPDSVKIFLKVSIDVAAKRIYSDIFEKDKKDVRNEAKISSMKEMMASIKQREKSDSERYKKYYGINMNDMKNYDIVIDTDGKTEEEVFKEVMKEISKRK